MAADYSTATAVVSPPAYQQHAYKTSANYNSMHSGSTTPANVSPTSPRSTAPLTTLHLPPRGIRPPKSPLYVPAVLRPTEKPTKSSPPKDNDQVDSAHSSFSATGRWPAGDGPEAAISRVQTEDWSEPTTPVTGPPSRNHWMPDNSTGTCKASACQTPFSFWIRRHHCRCCGKIFCGPHSSNQVPLDQDARFHPDGFLYRACDRCHSSYRQWEQRRTSRSNSQSSGGSNAVRIDSPTDPSTPTAATPTAATPAKRPDAFRVGSLASSVTNNWQWSTF